MGGKKEKNNNSDLHAAGEEESEKSLNYRIATDALLTERKKGKKEDSRITTCTKLTKRKKIIRKVRKGTLWSSTSCIFSLHLSLPFMDQW